MQTRETKWIQIRIQQLGVSGDRSGELVAGAAPRAESREAMGVIANNRHPEPRCSNFDVNGSVGPQSRWGGNTDLTATETFGFGFPTCASGKLSSGDTGQVSQDHHRNLVPPKDSLRKGSPSALWSGVVSPIEAPVEIVIVSDPSQVTEDLVAAFAVLIPQLSSSSPAPTRAELAQIVGSPDSVLFIARSAEQILGSLTLGFYRIPTGLKAWIEDVVVDDAGRGRGVGAMLNEAAIVEARARGAKHVNLTSRPSREAANRLYQRLGFELYPTNMYRYTL
jgi:GNAT superfamily N-acetyltransferase